MTPRRAALAACAALSLATPPAAQTGAPRVEAAVAAALMEDADAKLRAAKTAEAKLAALGQAVSAYESGLAVMRQDLRAITVRNAALKARIAAERAETDRLLGLLMTMGGASTPSLLAYPGGPVAHERAAMIIAGIAPQLRAKTAALRARLAEAETLRAARADARRKARAGLAALQKARAAAAAALAAAPTAPTAPRAPRAPTDRPPTPTPNAPAYGALTPPVVGVLTRAFGAPDAAGRPGVGVTLTAPAYAQVSAPFAATIRFAGPLEGYGNVVILEPAPGRLLVLAGLARIDRAVGETVLPGEPLGQLGEIEPGAAEFLIEAPGSGGAMSDAMSEETLYTEKSLYMEVREDGALVDPASWFAFAQ